MYSDRSNHLADELLNEYLDGELTIDAREVVQQHLNDCSECALRMRNWSLLIVEIEQLPDLEQAMDFVPQVLGQLLGRESRSSGAPWLMVGQLALALLLMVYGWLQLSILFPAELVRSWLSYPLQALNGMIDNLIIALSDALSQFSAWSPSSRDLLATVPKVPIDGTPYAYLGLMLLVLWIIGNHYLLGINGHAEDARP